MTGVVGGLLAAFLWGASGVAAARSTRAIGAEAALGWVYVVGLAAVLPLAVGVSGTPHAGAGAAGWAALAVVGAVVSLYLMYAALRRGPVVLVMPLTAAQGGLAAVVAVAAGEHLSGIAAAALLVMTLGMLVAMRRPSAHPAPHPTLAVALAALSAAVAASALFATPRAADELGTLWMLAILRIGGVLGLTLPLALAGRLRPPRGVLRFVVFSGLADAGAFGSYIYAATRSGVAVPAVLASQYAAVSAIMAALLLGERMTRVQLAGVVAILAGVAVVTGAQA